VKNRNLNAGRVLAVLVVLAMLPGIVMCDHEGAESLLILNVMPQLRKNQCTIQVGGNTVEFRSYGILDLMLNNQYMAYLHFRNMLQPINTITGESPSTPENEVHYMNVQRAKVFVNAGEFGYPAYRDSGAKNMYLKYQLQGIESFVSSFAAPQNESAVAVQVIPPELGNYLSTKMEAVAKNKLYPAIWVTVYVSLYAETQDQTVIKSNEFSYPIELCWGCLVGKLCSDEPTADIPCQVGVDTFISNQLCPIYAIKPGSCPACPR
jgi:hypothetical protein